MTTYVANSNQEERHGLFRKQAVEKQQDRLLGDVLVTPPLSYSSITAILIMFVAAAGALLVNRTYARKETVMLDEFLNQQTTLTEQLKRIPNAHATKTADLKQRIDVAETEITHLNEHASLARQQLELAAKQLHNIQSLAKGGIATQSDADTALEKELSLKTQLKNIVQSMDAATTERATLQIQTSSIDFEQMDREDQLRSNLSAIAQNIAQLHGQRAYILKANSTRVISNLQVSEGQEATTNVPLLTITPRGSELEAELLVPARAIGLVEVGQPVKMRYSAFNFQKFGLYDATITEVSQTVLLPSELAGVAINAQEPMYRVTAKLDKQNIEAYGKALSLKEGISLEADIKLAERTLLEWLLEPLLSLKGRL